MGQVWEPGCVKSGRQEDCNQLNGQPGAKEWGKVQTNQGKVQTNQGKVQTKQGASKAGQGAAPG